MKITPKAARINEGLSQKEAAEKLGISIFTLRNYESGKTYPPVDIIARMESTYHIKYADLNFLPKITL